MKTSKQMSDELLERKNKYQIKKAQQRQTALKVASASFIVVFAIVIGVRGFAPTEKKNMELMGIVDQNMGSGLEDSDTKTPDATNSVAIVNNVMVYCESAEQAKSSVSNGDNSKIYQYDFDNNGQFCFRVSLMQEDITGVYLADGLASEVYEVDGQIYQIDDTTFWVGWFEGDVQYSLYATDTTLSQVEIVLKELK